MQLDLSFDYWAALNPGTSIWEVTGSKDPDSRSPALRQAHQFLWSKDLPCGPVFDLEPVARNQLQWRNFRMGSDWITTSYIGTRRMASIVQQVPEHAEELFRRGCTIASSILFPAYQVNGKATINGARGLSTRIADRMDLTLEAIRRHYSGEESPLAEVLSRYADFFQLFVDFESYVDFWLLQDLVDETGSVRFYLPLDDFQRSAFPADVDEYLELKTQSVRFLDARARRIAGAAERQGRSGPGTGPSTLNDFA